MTPSALLAARRRKLAARAEGRRSLRPRRRRCGAPTLRVAAPDDVSYSKPCRTPSSRSTGSSSTRRASSAAPEGAEAVVSGAHDYVSPPTVVRRGHGGAALLTLCTLYSALARRVGLSLQIVRLTDQKEGPRFLLRLPGTQDQREMYVDVAARGAAALDARPHRLPPDRAQRRRRRGSLKRYVAPLSADELLGLRAADRDGRARARRRARRRRRPSGACSRRSSMRSRRRRAASAKRGTRE